LKRLFSKIGEAAEIIRKPFLFEVVYRSVETMECRISAEGVKSADVVIRPELGECGLFDFYRVKEIIRSGERAAEEALPRIRRALAEKVE
jgi:NTE family protein